MRFVRPLLRLVLVAAAVALVGAPSVASAEKKQKPSSVVELPPQTVTGRLVGPRVSIEISRVTPSIALTELHPPFAEKISQALTGASF